MIKVDNLKKVYKDTTLEYKSLEIKGKLTLIVGKNGSGKTTLLKALAKLINIEGVINQPYRCLFAEEQPSFPEEMKTLDYLVNIRALVKQDSHDRMMKLIACFKLDSHLNKPLKSLSKGMRQKVNITQVLMIPKALYLLDEPTNGFDNETLKNLVEWIKQDHAMYVCATHNQDVFMHLDKDCIHL